MLRGDGDSDRVMEYRREESYRCKRSEVRRTRKGKQLQSLSERQEMEDHDSPLLSVDRTQALWDEFIGDVIMRLKSLTSS